MSGLDRQVGLWPPNQWDVVTWLFRDLLADRMLPTTPARDIRVGDVVEVLPAEVPLGFAAVPVAVGVVTEINMAERPRQDQERGCTVKVRDMRPNLSTQEQEYDDLNYVFLRPPAPTLGWE